MYTSAYRAELLAGPGRNGAEVYPLRGNTTYYITLTVYYIDKVYSLQSEILRYKKYKLRTKDEALQPEERSSIRETEKVPRFVSFIQGDRTSMSSNASINIWLVRAKHTANRHSRLIRKTGRRLCRHQRQLLGLPARHAQDAHPVPCVPTNLPKRHSHSRAHTMAQPLPRRRHRGACCCALLRNLLHHIRGRKVCACRIWVPVHTRCARAQQLRRPACQLRNCRAR